MIGCDVVSTLLFASLPAAAWTGVLTTGQVIAVALLGGTANVFFATAYQVYLPSLVTAAELTEGNARLQVGASAASISGRALAGLAAQAIGAAPALLFNAASFGVSAACLLRTRRPPLRSSAAPDPTRDLAPDPASSSAPPGTRGLSAGIGAGLRLVVHDPYLRPLTLYPAAANLAYTGNLALVVVFLVRVVRVSPAVAGLLMAAGGFGGLLGAVAAPGLSRAFGSARGLVLVSLGTGLAGLLIPLTARGPWLACYLAGSMLIAAGIAVTNVIAGSFRQEYCPPSMSAGSPPACGSWPGAWFRLVPSSRALSAPPWAPATPCGLSRRASPPRPCSCSPAASGPAATCPVPA